MSSDGRFSIDQESAGRWFLLDEEQRDELGMARTSGPFTTLAAAQAAADERRAAPAPSSPLRDRPSPPRVRRPTAGRPSTAGRRSSAAQASTAGRPSTAGQASTAAHTPTPGQDVARLGRPQAQTKAPAPRPTGHAPARPKRASWLEALDAADPERARLARSWVEALGRLGIDDAEALVRRDIEADEPVIAERLLARAIIRRAVEPAVAEAVESVGATVPDEVAALLRTVATRAAGLAMATASTPGRDPEVSSSLPGWELLERVRPATERRRRVEVRAADLADE